MATNVQVTKRDNENATSALKRFTNQVRSAGVVQKLKSLKFQERQPSDLKRKQQALRRIEKRAEREHLRKLGKIK
jgi:ribosomal protein S21